MQLLTIIFGAALVIGVLYAIGLLFNKLKAAATEFARNVQANHQYDVLSGFNIAIGASPTVLILLGLVLDQNAGSIQNLLAAIIVAVAVIIGHYFFLKKKTDTQAALITVTILQVYGFLIIVVYGSIFLTVLLASLARSGRRG